MSDRPNVKRLLEVMAEIKTQHEREAGIIGHNQQVKYSLIEDEKRDKGTA